MAKDFNEKRKTTRKRLFFRVFCWETDGEYKLGKPFEIKTKDISADGMAFFFKENLPVGTLLWCEVYPPNVKSPAVCQAKIVSVKARLKSDEYILGAAFQNMDPEKRLQLAELIDKLDLYLLLDSALAGGASDIHLTVGRPPMARREGKILTMAADTIGPGQVEAMLYPLLGYDQIQEFEAHKELDFSFSPSAGARFRVNLHWQKGRVEATLRNIPSAIKDFSALGLPVEQIQNLSRQEKGLILIAGTTGAGKTTTMSSMIEYINQTDQKVIIAIEDPIEYVISGSLSIVKQRELGSDTESYAEALRRALRQDPDVICIGEMRDADSVLAAIQATETGRLVISTIHASDAISAVERAVNFFKLDQVDNICRQIASCLTAVLYQELLPGTQADRIVATELLINNNAVKNVIKENRFKQIASIMQTGKTYGMHTFQNSLLDLFKQGLISQETAEKYDRA